MILAHATVPLILCDLFQSLSLFALLLGSWTPNFDVIMTLLRKETPEDTMAELHGGSILHAPFFYLALLPVLSYFFGIVGATSFFLGGAIHVAMESLDIKGRPLLYPFRKNFYGLQIFPYDFWVYVTTKKIIAFEGIFLGIACILLLA